LLYKLVIFAVVTQLTAHDFRPRSLSSVVDRAQPSVNGNGFNGIHGYG